MKEVAPHRDTMLTGTAWMAVLVFIGLFLFIALSRIRYPYALEWAEGGMLDHVERILAGGEIYVRPSVDFTTFTYSPLYFYLSAAVCKLLGLSFFPLRLLSLTAALGCMLVLFLLVHRETGRIRSSLFTVALFAAGYPVCGYWFDLARVDSLFLLLLLLGFYYYRFGRNGLSAVFWALAFFTKQTGLVIAIPFVLHALLRSQIRRHYRFALIWFVLLTAGLFIGEYLTHGWFWYYLFYLPGLHPLRPEQIPHFIAGYLLKPFLLALLLAVFFFVAVWRQRDLFWFYLFAAVAMIGGSLIAGVPFGTYHNVALPAVAMVSILFGLGIDRLTTDQDKSEAMRMHPRRPGRSRSRQARGLALTAFHRNRLWLPLALPWLVIFQFLILLYNPAAHIPREKDRQAGDALVERIRTLPGRVFMPSHTYLLRLAGKEGCAHFLALEDALRSQHDPLGVDLRGDIAAALRGGIYSYIILDEPWFIEDVEAGFIKQQDLFSDPDVFWPLVGYHTRPRWLYACQSQ